MDIQAGAAGKKTPEALLEVGKYPLICRHFGVRPKIEGGHLGPPYKR